MTARDKLNVLLDQVDQEAGEEADQKAREQLTEDELRFADISRLSPAEYLRLKDPGPAAA